MKKIIVTVAMLLLFLQTGFSQAPAGINYQSVVRNASGAILSNTAVGVKIAIRQTSATGTVVYSETFHPTSSNQGLVNFVIGQGTLVSGNFNTINWGVGAYFCEVSIDVAGGANYVSMGGQQLMSVPYALYAKESGNGPQGAQGPAGPQGSVGPAGANGTNGANGATGLAGPQGPQGIQGLVGPAGATGAIGPAGAQGIAGVPGPTGSAGAVGATGPAGPQGVAGPTGAAGPAGSGGTLDQAYDFGGAGLGRTITVDSGPFQLNASGSNTAGMGILMTGTGNSINAVNNNAANGFAVIQAQTNSSTATNSAVFGQTSGASRGVTGEATATSTADAAVRGNNLRTVGGIGVEGVGFNGVSGQTNYREGYGVFGQNFDLQGPTSANASGVGGVGFVGVIGQGSYGVVGSSTNTAAGSGVFSMDNIGAAGTKTFKIDHPLDPENKFLNHYSIESNEVLNMYRGNVVADANGEAIVTLPDWFEAINKNFSYQLTPIGSFSNLFIKEKLADGKFKIGGAAPNMEVSWVVYAERNDAYMQQVEGSRVVEQMKTPRQQGRYLHPEFYGQPAEKGLFNLPLPKL